MLPGLLDPQFPRRLVRLFPLLSITLILLLAAILRFHLLDHQSLWNDEGNSLRLAERSIPDLIDASRRDIHPPGYYILLKGWLLLTGDSESALRALSAFAGVITVACVYALGRALTSPGAGALAALLVAINSFSIYYAQEARMYALLALLATGSMLVFVRWLARPTWRLAFMLALINAAGLYTQYTYPAVMLVQGVMFVLWQIFPYPKSLRHNEGGALKSFFPLPSFWGKGRGWGFIALNLLTLALFIPQLQAALAQLTMWPRTGQPVEAGAGLATVAHWLIYGNTTPILQWWAFIWPALFILAALIPDWMRSPLPLWWRRLLPWLWLIVTVGPLFALGLFREANLKFLLPAQIAAALLIGRGIWLLWEIGSPNLIVLIEALPRLAAGFGLLSLLTMTNDVLTNLYTNGDYARPDYRAMAQVIAANPRPGDAVILDAPNQQEVFTYYYRGSAPIYALPPGLGGDDNATIAAVTHIIARHRRIFVLYWGESERDPNRVVEKTLAAKAFEASTGWYGDVRFVQYATLPPGQTGETMPLQVRFGEAITLRSATLSARTLGSGDALGVTLTWTTERPLTRRYKIFVQLLDGEGRLVAQHDAEPGNNMSLTITWKPGELVADLHGIVIPPTQRSGDYRLIVGLYDVENPQARLTTNAGDYADLGTIKVTTD
jgi:mannosyltransferase